MGPWMTLPSAAATSGQNILDCNCQRLVTDNHQAIPWSRLRITNTKEEKFLYQHQVTPEFLPEPGGP